MTQSIEELAIRHARPEDGAAIVEFYNEVGGETDYLSFGQGEYPQTADEVVRSIEGTANSSGSCMLLMKEGERIIGIGTIHSSPKFRFKHVGVLGIVIRLSHCGNGLGRQLMNALIDWSKGNGLTKKITLVTRADNDRAIALYEKLGFQQEGIFRQESFDGERYYDSLSMALFL
ncbi:N-acetyltransferase [Sporosarcina sp. NCCP-2222]|uniref:GNAT family N-acetyltransferase n=1 Tax=Sporosarcina sp. NCCP-2222 TaxID=2935073 RepID=UPI002088CDBC|nr:GNAT family protein [Sporosarcina sp. NCCP-2222]GKV56569.1 N-acetyltransferase [Sporosarcina sp. NCCP-2222]